MDRGKERAILRTADLKRLIGQLESQRDINMDEVAKKQGELRSVEQVIKHTYEIILDINKEEQLAEEEIKKKEEQRILQEAKQKEAEQTIKTAARRKKKVEKKLDGLKNSTRGAETQERARAGRIAARPRRKNKKDSKGA